MALIIASVLIALSSTSLSFGQDAAQRAREVLDEALKTHGGREAWERVDTLSITAKGEVDQSGDIQGLHPDKPCIRSYEEKLFYQASTQSLARAVHAPRNDFSLRWRGNSELNGRTQEVIAFTLDTGHELAIFIDAENHTVTQYEMFVEFADFVLAVEAPAEYPWLETIPPENMAPSSSLGEQYLDIIQSTVPGKPIRYLALTHHHSDHVGGFYPIPLDYFPPPGRVIIMRHFVEWLRKNQISPKRIYGVHGSWYGTEEHLNKVVAESEQQAEEI